jgi:Putative mono-oxygenase ydhR
VHIQIVTFHLDGIDEAAYRARADHVAPVFAGLPGLRAKVWLADRRANTYGGLYIWDDVAAMRAYQDGGIFRGLQTDPDVSAVISRDFSVLAGPTRVTRGGC